jgi:hypothetical protein
MEVADQGMMIPLPANGLYFRSLGLFRPAMLIGEHKFEGRVQ